MKNFLKSIFLLIFIYSCDDGDLTIENIDFSTVTASSCGEIIYKINGNEAIYIQIPASRNAFSNDVTPTDEPRRIDIGGNVSVTYRVYNGRPSAANFCTSPGPISPVATSEWIATSGTVEINTIAVYTLNEATGATKITSYLHNIVFKNIVFAKPDGTQIYESFNFGNFSTAPTSLPFNFNADDVLLCSATNNLFNARVNGIEGISIEDFDKALLSTANLGVAKTALISATANKVSYRLFQEALTTANSNYYCSSPFPDFPPINEIWTAQNGVDGVSGIIEVTTTTNGTGFLHTIILKAVTFQRGNSTFYYGDAIPFGNLLTTD